MTEILSCILYPVSCIPYPVSCILYPVSCIFFSLAHLCADQTDEFFAGGNSFESTGKVGSC